MLNRPLIRAKVVQILYSYYQQGDRTILSARKALNNSCAETYDLYHVLLQLIPEITHTAEIRTEALASKFFASEAEKHPNMHFVENKFADQVFCNRQLARYLEDNKHIKHFWINHQDTVDNLYQQIRESSIYNDYMAIQEPTYDDDKSIWKRIFEKVLTDNSFLQNCMEDDSLFWSSDLDIVMSFVVKTIRSFKQNAGAEQELLPLYDQANSKDSSFAQTLLNKTIENETLYRDLINQRLKNWKLERLALMDLIIMQTAIAEIMNFVEIPIQVSINEYIELSKEYSSDQSPKFVNGILDDIAHQLEAEHKITKAVLIK